MIYWNNFSIGQEKIKFAFRLLKKKTNKKCLTLEKKKFQKGRSVTCKFVVKSENPGMGLLKY